MNFLKTSWLLTLVTLSIALFANTAYAVTEQTLSIIKPDAVSQNVIGKIITKFEDAGLKVVAMKMTHLNKKQAKKFYAVHKDKPFYNVLVNFMISGPLLVIVLEGQDAVNVNRDLMLDLRKVYGTNATENAVHGSDSIANAKNEIATFFKAQEICERTR